VIGRWLKDKRGGPEKGKEITKRLEGAEGKEQEEKNRTRSTKSVQDPRRRTTKKKSSDWLRKDQCLPESGEKCLQRRLANLGGRKAGRTAGETR